MKFRVVEAVRVVRSYHGEWSFQGAIDANPGDDDYRGGRLSLARSTNYDGAVRLNLGFMEWDDGFDDDRLFVGDDLTFAFYNPNNFDVNGGYLSVQFLHYPDRNRKVDFYWGLGPRVSVAEAEPILEIVDDSYFPYAWVDEIGIDHVTQLGVGLDASFGMEFFFSPRVSFLAEYGLTLEHRWYFFDFEYYDYEGRGFDKLESFDDDVYFDGSQIRLGMAVYF